MLGVNGTTLHSTSRECRLADGSSWPRNAKKVLRPCQAAEAGFHRQMFPAMAAARRLLQKVGSLADKSSSLAVSIKTNRPSLLVFSFPMLFTVIMPVTAL